MATVSRRVTCSGQVRIKLLNAAGKKWITPDHGKNNKVLSYYPQDASYYSLMWVAVVCTSHLSNVLLPVAASPAGTCLHMFAHLFSEITSCPRHYRRLSYSHWMLPCHVPSNVFSDILPCDSVRLCSSRPHASSWLLEESDHRTETLPWGLMIDGCGAQGLVELLDSQDQNYPHNYIRWIRYIM